MKKLIIFLTMLVSLSVPASATETNQTVSKLTKAETIVFLGGIPPSLNDTDVSKMAIHMCLQLLYSELKIGLPVYPVAEHIERRILEYANLSKTYGKLSKNDPKYKQKLAAFWNYYADRMRCYSTAGFYPTQHFYKRVLDMSLHGYLMEEFFFSDPKSFPIDVNVVEILPSGRVTTMIDYIDAALAMEEAEERYNVDEVEDLRDYLIEMHGAKRATEMDASELARRTAHAKKYSPFGNTELFPSPQETSIACTTSDLAQIQEEVEYIYDRLAHGIKFVDRKKFVDPSGKTVLTYGGKMVRGKKRNIFPSQMKCFSHPDFGTVFRQTIGVEYTKGEIPLESNVVYWRAISGDKSIKYDIF